MIVIANVFPKLHTVKDLLKTTLKEALFQNTLWQSTCESVPNTCEICMRALSSIFFMIPRDVDLENVSPSVRWNLRGVCWHIDCRCQVSCRSLSEFATSFSNAIIWKTKNFSSIFCSICGIYIKFWAFWKKRSMIVIANVFPKLQTVNILVRPPSKKRCFRTRFDSQLVKASEILVKYAWERFYHVF